jgi:hypothetical protein
MAVKIVTIVNGTDLDYFITGLDAVGREAVLGGRSSRSRAVCILGQTVREKLFGHAEAVGRQVEYFLRVIDWKRGQSSMGTDQDDVVLLPLRSFHRRLAGNTDIGTIAFGAGRRRYGEGAGGRGRLCRDAAISTVARKTISRSATCGSSLKPSPYDDADRPAWRGRRRQPVG